MVQTGISGAFDGDEEMPNRNRTMKSITVANTTEPQIDNLKR